MGKVGLDCIHPVPVASESGIGDIFFFFGLMEMQVAALYSQRTRTDGWYL